MHHLGVAVPVAMGHGHDQSAGAGCQVHGAADSKQRFAGHGPVGQVALFVHLQAAHDGRVHVAAPDHGEGRGAVEIAGTGQCGHRHLAGIDRVLHGAAGFRFRSYSQHAVFGMQDDAVPRLDQVRHQGGDADTQVHDVAPLQLGQREPCHHHAGFIHFFQARRHRCRGAQVLRVEVGLHQVIDEAARGVDEVRVQRPGRDDLLHLGDDQLRGGRGGLIEIVFRHTVLQVADGIGAPGPDDGNVGAQRGNEHHLRAVDGSGLTAVRQRCSCRGGREEPPKAGPAGADCLGQGALGQEFEFDIPGLCRGNGFRVAGEE